MHTPRLIPEPEVNDRVNPAMAPRLGVFGLREIRTSLMEDKHLFVFSRPHLAKSLEPVDVDRAREKSYQGVKEHVQRLTSRFLSMFYS